MTGPAKFRAFGLVVALILAAGLIGWRLVTLYSGPRPYSHYLPKVRAFLAAASASDSVALAATGASPAAIEWGLATSRQKPFVLRALSHGLGVSGGEQAGKSTFVLFRSTDPGICHNKLVGATFEGAPRSARLVAISTECGQP